MGFGQGLSGLNAASQDLDIIGNNIANSSTVGFKAASAVFADVYAQSQAAGLGVQVADVKQRFSVGNINITGGQYDIAIDGEKGFFRVLDTGGLVNYTRNGQFGVNENYDIVNAQGARLTGFGLAADGKTPNTNLAPVKLPVGNMQPIATSLITTQANLDANAPVITDAFDPALPGTYTHMLPITTHDSLGNRHELSQYFVKKPGVGNESVWEVHYRLADGTNAVMVNGQVGPHEMRFSDNGVLSSGQFVTLAIQNPGGTATPAADMSIDVSYTGSTSFGSDFAHTFTQNGYATGEFASISIANDGAIMANYTNGKSQIAGFIALANFANLQGLKAVGGNAWVETTASGQPVVGQPGTNGLALLKGQAVEASNVDMSQELVNMIVAQRTYQANAQSIKTQDQILQTLISLR
ncbi:flagellar hook protein FlgE [Pusillimonas sp. CC-YST705]|uniref:Flagellar hook protein FlgE n=1 Tax=Mesopusillimonas faecipullorum TaxID=2755040 RepID=A0ABS8C9U4_9BURK|nr:flagellar hook protein FlgE [Mesopusillimonas faecipullorum]MCB5362816.1 flagellar hook protein FlgE [Mesopusillimonas faecipullorum]